MSITITKSTLSFGKKSYDFEASLRLFVDPNLVTSKPPFKMPSPFGEETFLVKEDPNAQVKDLKTDIETKELFLSSQFPPNSTKLPLTFELVSLKKKNGEKKKYEKTKEVEIVPESQMKEYSVVFGEIGSLSFTVHGLTKKQLDDKKKEAEKRQLLALHARQISEMEQKETESRKTVTQSEIFQFLSLQKLFRTSMVDVKQQNNHNNHGDNNDSEDDEGGLNYYDHQNSNSGPSLAEMASNAFVSTSTDDFSSSGTPMKRTESATENSHHQQQQLQYKSICRFAKNFHKLCLNPSQRNFFTSVLQQTTMDSSEFVELFPILLRKVDYSRLTYGLGAETTVLNFEKYYDAKCAAGEEEEEGDEEDDGWVHVKPPPRPEELYGTSNLLEFCTSPKYFFKKPEANKNSSSPGTRPKMKPFQVFIEGAPCSGKTVMAKEIVRAQPWAPHAVAIYLPLHYVLAMDKELDNLKDLLKIALKNLFLRNSSAGVEDILGLMDLVDEMTTSVATTGDTSISSSSSSRRKSCTSEGDDQENRNDARDAIKNSITGNTLNQLITNTAEFILKSHIPIVWVMDDLDQIDRFDSETHVRRFLEEFISPSGRQAEFAATISRLSGSPVRPFDSTFCFTRDERKRSACLFYDGLHNDVQSYIIERWDKETCQDSFYKMVASKLPKQIPQAEVAQLVNFVAEANDVFFGRKKIDETASAQFRQVQSALGQKPSTTTTADGAKKCNHKNPHTAFFTGNPYFLCGLLASIVHDVVLGVKGPKNEKMAILSGAIKDSPLRLFEHFVALRLNNSVVNTMSNAFNARQVFHPDQESNRKILDEAGKVAIRLLAAMEDNDVLFTQDCGIGFSAVEWMQFDEGSTASSSSSVSSSSPTSSPLLPSHHRARSNTHLAPSGSRDFEAAVKELSRTRSGSFTQNLKSSVSGIFTRARSGTLLSSNSNNNNNNKSSKNDVDFSDKDNAKRKEERIDNTIIIKSIRAAILKSREFAFCSDDGDDAIPTPSWAEILASAGLLIKKEPPPLETTTQADAMSSSSNNNNSSDSTSLLLSAFPIYSFRSRMDMELFAASFLARQNFLERASLSLPWVPMYRVVWTALAAHVTACESFADRHNPNPKTPPVSSASFTKSQFIEYVASKYHSAYGRSRDHVDGVLLHQKRENLHAVRDYEKHQNAISSSMLIELAQIISPSSQVLDAVMKKHGALVVHLPSHLFWMLDCCGKFGNFESIHWLIQKIGSNMDAQRKTFPPEAWKKLVANALMAPLDDEIVFKLLEISKCFVPQLQSIELLFERLILGYDEQ